MLLSLLLWFVWEAPPLACLGNMGEYAMQENRNSLVFTRKFLTAWESGGRRMISNPTDDEKHMIFRALVRMIKTNSGDGFLNSDQGHPAYLLGAQGKVPR